MTYKETGKEPFGFLFKVNFFSSVFLKTAKEFHGRKFKLVLERICGFVSAKERHDTLRRYKCSKDHLRDPKKANDSRNLALDQELYVCLFNALVSHFTNSDNPNLSNMELTAKVLDDLVPNLEKDAPTTACFHAKGNYMRGAAFFMFARFHIFNLDTMKSFARTETLAEMFALPRILEQKKWLIPRQGDGILGDIIGPLDKRMLFIKISSLVFDDPKLAKALENMFLLYPELHSN